MKEDVWECEGYYEQARVGSENKEHFGMRVLFEDASKAKKILDMGCGEGTRLASLPGKNSNKYGVDISKLAIKKARKKYPNINFKVGNLEELNYSDDGFDLVYSAFVLEHLDNPEKVLEEAIRVTRKRLVLIAPNFGAPNRISPVSAENRVSKLLRGFVLDFKAGKGLNWKKVEPISDRDNYEMDWDTKAEPYILSLMRYLRGKNMKAVRYSSCWSEELPNASLMQRVFRFFGQKKVFPFTYWGPHLVVECEKQ